MEKDLNLAAFQAAVKCPKDLFNSFGKYKYRSAESILEAVKPACQQFGLAITLSDRIVLVMVEETITQAVEKDGTQTIKSTGRVYVEATASLIAADGRVILSATAYAREPQSKKGMDISQITGTASSYARKYALGGLLGLDDTKDADTDEHVKEQRSGEWHQRNAAKSQGPFFYCVESVKDLKAAEDYLEGEGATQVVEGFPLWKADKSCPKLHTKEFLRPAAEAKEIEEHYMARLFEGYVK